ncbi:MAG: pantoate--beta-alanine ligase [Bradymonadia bacterium]
METLTRIEAVGAWSAAHQREGRRVVLVPTMGALHAGHQALMRAAADHGDAVLASIFVNPTQFGAGEDFEQYPRDAEGDLAKAAEAGVHAVFMPTRDMMYPSGHQTTIHTAGVSEGLCGAHRPGHFDGVCTVVLKLFNITRCDAAIFGEKDFQQLAVIRRMVADLDVPVEVVGHPIVREPDGLAMSSRNIYLSASERQSARSLSRSLAAARGLFAAGNREPKALEAAAHEIIAAAPGTDIEYVSVRRADTLQTFEGAITQPCVLALAVKIGQTRLIDNMVLTP